MTAAELIAFYPQFQGFSPAVVLADAVEQANARFGDFSPTDTARARRLYAAHLLTLYAFTALPAEGTPTMERIAAAGKASTGRHVSGRKVGEVSVTYSSSSSLSSSASSDLADLTETAFGLQLLTLLRLYARSVYIP